MTRELPASGQRSPVSRQQKAASVIVFIVALVLCAWINGRWIRYRQVPSSPAEDLAKHVALAVNFRVALAEGQYPPRLQAAGIDLHDVPVFQYYGFFEGLVAWPFLKLGFSGIQAVTLAIVFLRWAAFAVVYATARLLRAGPPASALAGFAYILSPYIINNQLSRVAIAEVHAHNLLPLCFLGWAMILRGRRATGATVISLAVAFLSLTHNIFFLYSAVLLGVLMLGTLPDWRGVCALILGGVAGVLICAPQWYPAILSQPDLVLNFLERRLPFARADLGSLSGLWGWPRPYGVPAGVHGTIQYYFTFAWWTIPAAAGLLWAMRGDRFRRKVALALLAAGTVFFLLVVPPLDFWAILPLPFAALQFPYRLIAYVALVSALGIALALPGLSWRALSVLLPLMLLSQWKVIQTDALHLGRLRLPDEQVASIYSLADYDAMQAPKSAPSDIRFSNHALEEQNHVLPLGHVSHWTAPTLSIAGYDEAEGPLTLRLVPSVAGEQPPPGGSPEVSVSSGPFSVQLPMIPGAPEERLVCEWSAKSTLTGGTFHPQPIRVESVDQRDSSTELLLPVQCLEPLARHAYERTFRISPALVSAFGPLGKLCSGDGWLREDNLIGPELRQLHLRGVNGLASTVRLFAASPNDVQVARTATFEVAPGAFDITVPLPDSPRPLRLYYSPFMVPHELNMQSPDTRKLALTLDESSARVTDSLYSAFVFQTPVAYNRFWEAFHEGRRVPTISDAFYHLCVVLKHPAGTITVRYHPPVLCWMISLLGTLLCVAQLWIWRTTLSPGMTTTVHSPDQLSA